ncbi:MAG: DUF5591 domain-containing protein [Thermoplasmatales archaeon]|nr:MAG: DUF5591 domain-containing protein [Thermoplasmatales archaeon]
MQFSVKNRDGPARIGELLIENKRVTTPNILFVNTSKKKAPNFSDILITNDKHKRKKPTIRIGNSAFSSLTHKGKGELSVDNYLIYPKDVSKELHLSSIEYNKKTYECCLIPANKEVISDVLKNNDALLFVVVNALQLLSQQSKFVEFITELREIIGYQRMIYTPCVGCPSSFALLAYIGVDFFDSISAIIAARNEILLFPTRSLNKNELNEIPCSCPSCSKMKGKVSEMGYLQILNHNYFAILDEIKQVRNAIALGNIRELVETRIRSDPSLASILKILDFKYYNFLEERTPVVRKNKLIATSKESLFRPEIKRFQERVIKRYQKPKDVEILLFLPCSAKKPYSFSKSHRLFRDRIFNSKNPHIVHEVIITSPLGIVPRELELTYPASVYDIAVTGRWGEDEKKMIRNLLKNYLEINVYDKKILHVSSNIQDFVIDLIENPVVTCVENPTSKESLDELSNVLKKMTSNYHIVKSSKRVYENMEALASYQFGGIIAEKLLKNCKIKGKYPYQKIIDDNKQLGMLTKERGLISLTMEGAIKIANSGKYWVEIYDDFTLKGSVFAPGIKDADESIRIGDEVIVLKNNTTCGVGVAQMNGIEMKETKRGEAVKIRHRT